MKSTAGRTMPQPGPSSAHCSGPVNVPRHSALGAGASCVSSPRSGSVVDVCWVTLRADPWSGGFLVPYLLTRVLRRIALAAPPVLTRAGAPDRRVSDGRQNRALPARGACIARRRPRAPACRRAAGARSRGCERVTRLETPDTEPCGARRRRSAAAADAPSPACRRLHALAPRGLAPPLAAPRSAAARSTERAPAERFAARATAAGAARRAAAPPLTSAGAEDRLVALAGAAVAAEQRARRSAARGAIADSRHSQQASAVA